VSPTKYKLPRENRHRYSRSLTSEEPRSLPVPPSRSPSPSPASGNAGEDEEDDTPRMRQRSKRADTLPSSTLPALELPEDPKIWSPTHLSAYLSSTLQGAGAGDQVTRDITAFIKERQITGKTFLRLNEDDLNGYVFFFTCFYFYLVLITGLNQRFELPNTHHPILLSASRSLRQNVLRGRIWGFELGHNFPVHSPQDDDFSSNSSSVGVGRRSRNTSFDSTSNGNGRVKDMIASLERSSSSEDDNDDEGGGRRSTSPNKSQRNSTSYSPTKEQQHSMSNSHSPTKTQRNLPPRGTVHDLFSFSAPSPVAGRGPSANTREESNTRTEGEETIKSPHQARLLPYPPLLTPVHTGSGSGSRSPFVSTGSPFAPASMDAAGLYELGYRHVPLPLSSVPTGSSGSTSPFVAIPIPLGVGGPGQQHARPLPLPPPHTGQQLLLDPPPLSSAAAGVAGERKREGVATTVTDSGSVIHHPRPRPGVGVEGLVGFYDVARDTSGDDVLRDTSGENVPPPSDDGRRPGAGPDTQTEPETETETEGGYDTAPSQQLSEDGGDEPSMVDLLLSHSPAHPITGAEAWELELGETVKHVGAASAGEIGGSAVVRTGRGRKVRAKVGGKPIEEKDEGKGKGEAEGTGKESTEERVEGKGKAQEGTQCEEDEREKEDAGDERKPDLWTVFDLDPPRGGQRAPALGSGDVNDLNSPSTLDSHSALDHTTEHNLTVLRATLITRQEALDQRELGLAARQEGIDGMVERVREVQRAVGHREEAVGRREEVVGRREKEMEEREEAVGRREREVREREDKVAELEQAVDERERGLDQRGSELEERSKRVEALDGEMETRSGQLGASTSAPGSNSWPIALLRSVVFRVLGDRTSSFLFCSCPPSSNPSSSSNPDPSTTTPSPSSAPPQRRPRRDWEARRDLYLSTGGRGSYLVLVGIGVCAVVLKVLVRRLTGVGMWSWLARSSRR